LPEINLHGKKRNKVPGGRVKQTRKRTLYNEIQNKRTERKNPVIGGNNLPLLGKNEWKRGGKKITKKTPLVSNRDTEKKNKFAYGGEKANKRPKNFKWARPVKPCGGRNQGRLGGG